MDNELFILKETKAYLPHMPIQNNNDLLCHLASGDLLIELLNKFENILIEKRRQKNIFEQNILFNEIFATAKKVGIRFTNIGTEDFVKNKNEKLMMSFLRAILDKLKYRREEKRIPELPLKKKTYVNKCKIFFKWVRTIVMQSDYKSQFETLTFDNLTENLRDGLIFLAILKNNLKISEESQCDVLCEINFYKRMRQIFQLINLNGICTKKFTEHEIISGGFSGIKLLIKLYNMENTNKILQEDEEKFENTFTHKKEEDFINSDDITYEPVILSDKIEKPNGDFLELHNKHVKLAANIWEIISEFKNEMEDADMCVGDRSLEEQITGINLFMRKIVQQKAIFNEERKNLQKKITYLEGKNDDLNKKLIVDLNAARDEILREVKRERKWWFC